MEDFEIGNVVQLRSGGPKMTVHGLVSDAMLFVSGLKATRYMRRVFPGRRSKRLNWLRLAVAGGKMEYSWSVD
jgi:uncharacterized protein YodC (DUF2158 family)